MWKWTCAQLYIQCLLLIAQTSLDRNGFSKTSNVCFTFFLCIFAKLYKAYNFFKRAFTYISTLILSSAEEKHVPDAVWSVRAVNGTHRKIYSVPGSQRHP